MKNEVNEQVVKLLADKISNSYPEFDSEGFVSDITGAIKPLELFERLDIITKTLHEYLSDITYIEVTEILIKSAGKDLGFVNVSLTNYCSSFGLDDFDISMETLKELTKSLSSEFSIRHFIIKDKERVIKHLRKWVHDPDVDVRRLVSEGLRPRLPWGVRLQDFVKDPDPIWEFLEILKESPEEYVRKSVGNNINDIAKDHPDMVVDKLKSWEFNDIVVRGLRTLVKQGHQGALVVMGFTENPKIKVKNTSFDQCVTLGDDLSFSFEIESESTENQRLVVDFIIYLLKANGKKSPKVFKLKNIDLEAGESIVIRKKHPFKVITTRKYYPGEHSLAIKINGKEFTCGNFTLSV